MMKLLLVASAHSLLQSQTMAVRDGYDPRFLGEEFEIPFPTFSSDLQADVLQEPSTWLPYIHYSVATNKDRRQPICIALNIDLNLMKSAYRGDFIEDDRIGAPFQLNNDYYKNNEWDRGHMARRSSASWGETEEDAQDASDDTMFYTNSCLQHENLNQDEWLALEDWVLLLENTDNGRISTFTGPIYGYKDGVKESLTPSGRETAEIPAAFYKIVTFIGKDTKEICTRAFIMIQNSDTIKDKIGKKTMNLRSYQVSVKMIEEATGLNFPTMMGDTNPIYYKPGSNEGMIPVDGRDEIINPGNSLPEFDDDLQILIAAACINASGDERTNEWVSVANYSPNTVDLGGWAISDTKRNPPLTLFGTLQSGETIRIGPLRSDDGGSVILSNSGGVLRLQDPNNRIVDRVQWTTQKEDGSVLVFPQE